MEQTVLTSLIGQSTLFVLLVAAIRFMYKHFMQEVADLKMVIAKKDLQLESNNTKVENLLKENMQLQTRVLDALDNLKT